MKKIPVLLLAMLSSSLLFAQPANDDCPGIIDLGVAPICPSPAVYTNVDATESMIGNDNFPNCFNGNPVRDVWFSFVASAAVLDYQITVSGITMTMPQVAVYRGDCELDGLVLLDCAAANVGENEISIVLTGLTPGLTYFLRINDWTTSAAPNAGSFELCVEEFIDTEFNIDETGSDFCEGSLYDTGGPDGNYGFNENNSFTICPDDPGACIVLTVSEYIIANNGDFLTFYDGPDNNSPVIGNITGGSNGNSQGGVCYQVVANSGCLTVEMISGGFPTFPGFEATWQCTDDCPVSGGLSIEPGPAANEVAAAFDNPFFEVTITNILCDDGAYGVFANGNQTNLGLSDGLLLTTGVAAQAANPASFFANNDLNLGGDPDLNVLNDLFGFGGNTNDACFVEMDVVAKTDKVTFEYVFGSDEYKQMFSSASDDLIGVLISGPGITGLPGLNFQENLADLPTGTDGLVSIQNVNATDNWQYFRNNLFSQTIAYNGLTSGFLGEAKTLFADRTVTPCETYHVKIAIGDTDENDDSGLFIKPSHSFKPEVFVNFNNGIDYLVEGCVSTQGLVNLTIPEALVTPYIYEVEIVGTATLGTDYLLNIPTTLTFNPGETLLTFPITVLTDGLAEGTETITINLIQDFGCGAVQMGTHTIELEDALQVNILQDEATIFVCDGIFTTLLQATGAASYAWSPANIFDNPNAANVTATIGASQTVTVTGTVGTCTATDEVFLQLVSPVVEIVATGGTAICQGETVLLNATNNVNGAGLTWSPTFGLTDPTSAQTPATPFATTTYTATVGASGCTASDEITITVTPFNFPTTVANDSLICQNSSVKLASNVNNSTTEFQWAPDLWLDDATIAGATATPESTTTYTLTATSPDGTCSETAEVTITVFPADIEILPDTLQICLGDSLDLTTETSTGGTGLTWSPTDSLLVTGAESVTVFPRYSTWYVGTLTVGTCVVKDSVFVKVDSLPGLFIEAIPAKAIYCEGENISLVSPNFASQNFPDIVFDWMPEIGFLSEDSLYNLVVNATETTTYVRTTMNGACSSMDSFSITVVPVASITVTPPDPEICPGESVGLVATADQPIDAWEWSPAAGLSCTDCPNPTATPPGNITYQVTAEFMGCPSFATVTIDILPPPVYDINDFTMCPGAIITLNDLDDPDAVYQWTDALGNVFSTEAQPEVSPAASTFYTLTISNGNCPAITEQINVRVVEDFEWSASVVETACPGDEIILSANANISDVTLIWRIAVTEELIGTAFEEIIIPYTITETTTFEAVAISELECFTKMETFTVSVTPDFTISATADPTGPVLGGQEVTLTATGSAGGLDFVWTDSDGTVISMEAVTVVSSCATATYDVTATDANGCEKDTFLTIEVVGAYSIDSLFIIYENQDTLPETVDSLYEGQEFQIGVVTTPSPLPSATYVWFVNGTSVDTTTGPLSALINAPEIAAEQENFFYSVVVTDAEGCSQFATNQDVVFNNPVDVPNVFTPNGDMVNEVFVPVSKVPLNIIEFKVWNRWGQVVYNNENGPTGWSGQYKDEPAASDVYIYRIVWEIAGGNGTQVVEKGDVTLLR